MTADSRLARAVPFPEFGPDYVLRFTTADLVALEGLSAHPWLDDIERRLTANDTGFIREAVKLGLKKPDGFARPELSDDDLNDLPFSPAKAVRPIADALSCAITGQAYADILADREKARAEAAEMIERSGGLQASFTTAKVAE